MKRLFVFILALVALFFVASCAKEMSDSQEPITNEVEAKPVTHDMVFTFKIGNPEEDPDSKLIIADNGKTKWEIGDAFYIHGAYMNTAGYYQIVTIDGITNTLSADQKTATIHVTTTEEPDPLVDGTVRPYVRSSDYATTLYAIYPASAAVTRGFQCYYYSEFAPSNEPIMAGCDNGDGSFTFKNLCGVVSFKLSDSITADHYVFSGNNGETVAYSTYAARYTQKKNGSFNEVYGGNYESIVYTSGQATSVSGEVINDGEALQKICIPGGANFTNGFTILLISGGDIVGQVSTNTSINVPVNGYLPLGDVAGYVKPYVHAKAPWTGSATDISGGGETANCYVVSKSNAGQAYKMPAKQGNSDVTITPASVQILWETWNNAEKEVTANSVIAAVDYDDSWIYFKLPDVGDIHAGNALIAAKNALGTILWSWHIWMPETNYTTGNFGGIITTGNIMSRNLGGLVDATTSSNDIRSAGLLYQWGRKDPFLSAGAFNSSTLATMSAGSIPKSITDVKMTVEQSVANPTVFVKTKDTWYDWANAHNKELWGDTGSVKTKYDPCPPGYRVMKRNSGNDLWTVDADILNTVDSKYTIDEDEHYWKMGDAVFPLSGFLYHGSGNIDKNRSVVWCDHQNGDNAGYCLYVFYSSSKWQAQPGWGNNKTSGGSVRCQVKP